MPPSKLRVFWDLDSCRPPTYSTPWDVIHGVRLFTSNFGIVTDIRAYWDSNKISTVNPASEALRAAMPSMGINIVDCSLTQGYTGDALTRRLSVDVLILAIDESASANTYTQDIIVILSGDESILYPISLLMFRNYTIFLVVPDDKSNIQPSQATRIFNWQRDVLGTRIEEPSPIPEAVVSTEAIVAPETSPPPAIVPDRAWIVFGKRVPQRPVTLDPTSVPTPRSGSRSVVSPGPPLPPRAPSGLSSNSTKINVMESNLYNATDTQASTDTPAYRALMPPLVSPPLEPEQPTGSDMYGGWNANGQWTAGDWNVEPEWRSSKTHKLNPSMTRSSDPSNDLEEGIDEMLAHAEHPSPPPKDVPLSVFDPLVRILRETKGRSMSRSKLGEEMTRYKSIYKETSVKNLGDYIALAVKKELVIAGGIGNNQYVRLHPKVKKNEA